MNLHNIHDLMDDFVHSQMFTDVGSLSIPRNFIIPLSALRQDRLQQSQLSFLSVRGLSLRRNDCTATSRSDQSQGVVDRLRSGFYCFILSVVCLSLFWLWLLAR